MRFRPQTLATFTFAALAHATLVGSPLAQCGATISTPAVNATWTLQNSPYCVTQTINVGNLTIEPGVEVRLTPGATLRVVSWLRANGTAEQPVVFRAQDLSQGRWGGIEFAGPVQPNNASLLSNCVITGSGNGGVRIVNNEQVSLVGCRIAGNISAGSGGGLSIQLGSGSVLVEGCDIVGNSAAVHGGGVHAVVSSPATATLRNCRIDNNVCNPAQSGGSHEGGGIWLSGNLNVEACSVVRNRSNTRNCGAARAVGGGIYAQGGVLTVRNTAVIDNRVEAYAACTIAGNHAQGGGIFAANTVTELVLRNSTIACNSAFASGYGTSYLDAAIVTSATTDTFENCTIARNNGIGVHVAAGAATLTNCIVYEHPVAALQGNATATYCNIQGGYQGVGNIDFNPSFVGSGCEPEHFALTPFSACIDTGDPSPAFFDACLATAQGSSRNDIGALGGPGSCGFTGPNISVCGAQSYGRLQQAAGDIVLDWSFTGSQPPYPGSMTLEHGTANRAGLMLLGFAPVSTVIGGATILVDPNSANPLPFVFDAQGEWSAPIPLSFPFLVGVPVFVQAVELSSPTQLRGSNGLRMATCY